MRHIDEMTVSRYIDKREDEKEQLFVTTHGNTESTGRVEIRRARAEDRAAVLAFSKHTWDWGDYIEFVWDEWLDDPQGYLFVATIDEQPVGVAHLRLLNATEAWLEGMRVDPHFRLRGIAKALYDAELVEAMNRGATMVRYVTESTNTGSIALAEHHFMRRVGAYAPYVAGPITAPSKGQYGITAPQLATASDLEEIIDYLNASSNFPLTGGLYYHSFIGYTITDELLTQKIAEQQVYLMRRWQRLDGLAIAEPRDGRQGAQLSIGYIDGTTESISMIALALRGGLAAMGLESVYAYTPDLMMIRDAFTGAEYNWEGNLFYTFERSLT